MILLFVGAFLYLVALVWVVCLGVGAKRRERWEKRALAGRKVCDEKDSERVSTLVAR